MTNAEWLELHGTLCLGSGEGDKFHMTMFLVCEGDRIRVTTDSDEFYITTSQLGEIVGWGEWLLAETKLKQQFKGLPPSSPQV